MPRRFPDDPRPFEVLDRKYLFRRPPWLVLRQDHLRLPTGRRDPGVLDLGVPALGQRGGGDPADEVVMIRQYRPGIDDVHFEIPAGVVDGGDADVEAAARRELAEETGYGGGRWSALCTLSANPALTTNLTYTYLAEGVTPLGAAAPEATEDLRVHLVPVAEIAGADRRAGR